MFGSALPVMGVIQTLISLGTLGLLAVSLLRSAPAQAEEAERGDMRSMSWPGQPRD